MTVQNVCKQTGLTVDTIRYYQRIGLVTVEKGDYFINYTQESVDVLLAIKKLRLSGMSLGEIKRLLSIDAEPADLNPKQLNDVSEIVDNALKRTKIRAKEIAEAQQLLENMKNKLNKVNHEDC